MHKKYGCLLRQAAFANAEPDASSSNPIASHPGKPGIVMENVSLIVILSLTFTKSHGLLPWEGTDSSGVKDRISAWLICSGS